MPLSPSHSSSSPPPLQPYYEMSLNLPNSYHQLPLPSTTQTSRNLSILHRRTWKSRRKLKKLKSIAIRSSHFNFDFNFSPFGNLFNTLISQFPSPNSLDFIAPALGLASGAAAIYLSQLGKNLKLASFSTQKRNKFVGEWILFTSPTPFNRFVVLRCPSISFEGSEFLEDVNEKLVKEDRHFVRLNSGRIQVTEGDEAADEVEEDEEVKKLVYQRVCVGTEDGGVLSLDWPANLDLEEERGLDTTLFIVPGTAEGSMDRDVRVFVCECLRRGYFPVVMNPRGCAGAPITTARLFTAADSDDISTAIQYINKARPWTTLMGIGWGYGANMLTKYLAEAGEKTPLTAATCIDNPFDLDEATRSSPYHISFDQKLTSGLKDILRSNKELFQGRAKGFNVEKALLATSVRDFEKAISMVSYGFGEIEDFYSKSSTRDMIGKVKIPLLFIQNDNGTVPLFSTPRSLIAENPFTSLLLCSYLPSSVTTCSRSTISWCQHVTIEWLTAVELGLLKGRHPLLKDIDVTINPLKDLAFVEGRASNKSGRVDKLLNLPNSASLDVNSLNHLKEMFGENGYAANFHSRSRHESNGDLQLHTKGLQRQNDKSIEHGNAVDAELVEDEVGNPVDGERGQVLQTTEVVMTMLDVTMPDTLTEEQKKKVLTAVAQGETLMTALQDAVPADVREKLTTAVSGILHNPESNLKVDKLLSLGRIPDVASRLKSKVQEKAGGTPTANGENEDHHSSSQKKGDDDLADSFNSSQPSKDETVGEQESDPQASDNLQKSFDSSQFQPIESQASDIPDSDKKGTGDLGNIKENADSTMERTNLTSDYRENESETVAKPELPSRSEGAGSSEDRITDQYKEQDGEKTQTAMKEESGNLLNEGKTAESSVDQTKTTPVAQTDDRSSSPASSSEIHSAGKEGDDNFKKEEKSDQPGSTQNGSKLPSFSVSQAIDALTGMDDSTQVAVNSVFNVIEDMITQLEEGRDSENVTKDRSNQAEVKGENNGLKLQTQDEVQVREVGLVKDQFSDDRNVGENGNRKSIPSHSSHDIPHSNHLNSEEKSIRDSVLFSGGNTAYSQESNRTSDTNGENWKNTLAWGKLSPEKALNFSNSSSQHSLYVTENLYGEPIYRGYLRNYLISKMRNTKVLDLHTTTALFLDYIPEEGQWKLLERTEDNSDNDITTHLKVRNKVETNLSSEPEDADNVIEPSYVILDSEKQPEQVEKGESTNRINGNVEIGDSTEDFMLFVKSNVLDTLKLEVGRRVSTSDIEEMQPKLAEELEFMANAVCLAVRSGPGLLLSMKGNGRNLEKFGTLEGDIIVRSISSALQDTSYLRTVLPLGVVVGSSLAALRKYFDVNAVNCNSQNEDMLLDQFGESRNTNHAQPTVVETDEMLFEKINQNHVLDVSVNKSGEKAESEVSSSHTAVVGAVTAALGASALLIEHKNAESAGTLYKPDKEKDGHWKGSKDEEEMSEKTQNNIITSLAEKAMSVAAPVVPTKEGGGVDQERLVAMLAELGQKGGILKLVGKIALLWGGMRGAMSLTEKLISFLRLAERPFFQRILGFVCLVLLLWSPIVIPLFPTLVQSWAMHKSSRIAELACIIGLYVSSLLMVTLWGKRIRGYDNPLEQYGLVMNTPLKVQNFVKGLIGGVMLVLLIHSVNFLCGFVQPSWSTYLPLTSSDAVAWLKVSGRMLLLVIRGLATATGIAVVEELLFRSWLPDEITADFGYYRGIIISGLVFSLSQRSPWAIPGLWLLSLALAGARHRNQGSLSLPIGLRAGILLCSFILQTESFLTYQPNFPIWLCGSHPFQPFSGAIGLALSLPLAIMLYPR